MKLLSGCLLSLVLTQVCNAQFYYKDLVSARQTKAKWQLYKSAGVRSVSLNSFDGSGQPLQGFVGTQEVASDYSRISTHTKSVGTPESWTIAYYSPQGLLQKTIDSSDTYQSISEYQYDAQGRISSILNTSIETDNHVKETEQHIWQYDPTHPDLPSGMLKVKNMTDTTYIRFVFDEKGNVAEERSVRNKQPLPVIYYYYDAGGRMTDIVRYNPKAQRLLPANVFDYNEDGKLNAQLIVPSDNSDYQKWLYAYNEKGLESKEVCYDKHRELLGKIEYQYTFK